MSDSVLITILGIVTPILTVILGGLGSLFLVQLNRWKAKEQLKADQELAIAKLTAMKENATQAVQAVEQLYPDKPGEEKKKLALEFAQALNTIANIPTPTEPVADIPVPISPQLILNESNVLTLPPTNKPVPEAANAGASTMDETLPPKREVVG